MTAFLTQQRVLVVVLVLLLINTQLKAQWATKLGHIPRAVVSMVVSPFSGTLHSFSTMIRGRDDRATIDVGPGHDLATEYGFAKQRIIQLEDQLDKARRQIEALSQIRAVSDLSGFSLVDARVTGYQDNPLKPVLTIDRGTNRGIHAQMAVSDGFNLVGRVNQAFPATADVELITARGTQLQVRIVPATVDAGPRDVREMITLNEARNAFEVTIDKDDPVQVGDLAHLIDERWPAEARGLVVGRVTRVSEDPQNKFLFKRVVIHPMPALTKLDRVTVLVPTE